VSQADSTTSTVPSRLPATGGLSKRRRFFVYDSLVWLGDFVWNEAAAEALSLRESEFQSRRARKLQIISTHHKKSEIRAGRVPSSHRKYST
jgi:hypothetical protein